jgi:hypothetical protein
LDYKDPGTLAASNKLAQAREQIERYLNTVTDGRPLFNPGESAKWAGVLWDGFHLAFCNSSGMAWIWSQTYETSEASLLSLAQIYRSLGRLPLTATLLTSYFGKNSDVAKAVLPVMCSHLSKPKHRTTIPLCFSQLSSDKELLSKSLERELDKLVRKVAESD